MPFDTHSSQTQSELAANLAKACSSACQQIAPAWPLDQAVAVNPHWQRIGMPLDEVAARLALLGGMHLFPNRHYLKSAWEAGDISPASLQKALRHQQTLTADECIAALDADFPARIPLLIDLLDNQHSRHRLPWRDSVTFQISQTCAAYFDDTQAHWQPECDHGLYAFWHDTLLNDRGISQLIGIPHLHRLFHDLPSNAEAARHWAMQKLRLPQNCLADYLEALLLSINGWASWCAWLGWQADGKGNTDDHLLELLSIRLAWGGILQASSTEDITLRERLHTEWGTCAEKIHATRQQLAADNMWQTALDASYQNDLIHKLTAQPVPADSQQEPAIQAIFCIDTRSEPLRRALEAACPGLQTKAFAGFFGLPITYTPFATQLHRPQLPGPTFPQLELGEDVIAPNDVSAETVAAERKARAAAREQTLHTIHWPNTTFSFVEAVGIGYLQRIYRWIRPSSKRRRNDDQDAIARQHRDFVRPRLQGLNKEAKVALAANILHTTGLDAGMAPLVILVGHASQSANNAHASTLDCGACYGQSGEANARALAALLNEAEVRSGLADNGIHLPDNTHFMAGLHNTTTDDISGFDLDLLPRASRQQWERLQPSFLQAGDQVRRERADSLWMNPKASRNALLAAFRRRANDGAQTRPEWGLTGNTSFLIGARALSESLALHHCFLHDYATDEDTDGQVLEQLMMGPLLVCHWISWQYHASVSDPLHFGSGNKVLHNVVGGHIGVFEGNGGDLRIGLPKQSLHDGDKWRHTPVRLTVIIEAPRARIKDIVQQHAVLRQLVGNGWMHLWRIESGELEGFDGERWGEV